MSAYYNENDPFAAQWLRNLVAAGHIASGEVDERSIVDVRGDDLRRFIQCHFFAGIGIWSYALRLAGWDDARPAWTGSCPCQPFSAAGRSGGFSDERHLWPHWARLIGECRPDVIFGEQVASRDGLAWLDFVSTDLEAAGYAVGAVDTCAAGFGAPHIRQRLYFVADAQRDTRDSRRLAKQSREGDAAAKAGTHAESGRCSSAGDVGDAGHASGRTNSAQGEDSWRLCICAERREAHDQSGDTSIMGDASGERLAQQRSEQGTSSSQAGADEGQAIIRAGAPTNGFWRDAEWLPCIDGKARAVEPGTFPLAHGAPARVGRLRAYGNAISAPQAEAFIRAYMECRP